MSSTEHDHENIELTEKQHVVHDELELESDPKCQITIHHKYGAVILILVCLVVIVSIVTYNAGLNEGKRRNSDSNTFTVVNTTDNDSLSYEYSINYIETDVNQPLYDPPVIDLTYNDAKVVLYVRLCRWAAVDKSSEPVFIYINMTRYCYCTDESDPESCTYPGPTLRMHNGTKINVTVVNQVYGSEKVYGPGSQYWNAYKDIDTTNIHVHGIHVSPEIDDILVKILPNSTLGTSGNVNNMSHSYLYDIGYHYPGTFWYHAHHH